MPRSDVITSPEDPKLDTLCEELAARSAQLDKSGEWPAEQLELCGRFGVYQWFLPAEWGGLDWSELDLVRGYLRLSAACLTTTFIITQRSGACRALPILLIVRSSGACCPAWPVERHLPPWGSPT